MLETPPLNPFSKASLIASAMSNLPNLHPQQSGCTANDPQLIQSPFLGIPLGTVNWSQTKSQDTWQQSIISLNLLSSQSVCMAKSEQRNAPTRWPSASSSPGDTPSASFSLKKQDEFELLEVRSKVGLHILESNPKGVLTWLSLVEVDCELVDDLFDVLGSQGDQFQVLGRQGFNQGADVHAFLEHLAIQENLIFRQN